MHLCEVEGRRKMEALKVGLASQPAVAPARSGVAASSSERTLKSQLWFESAGAILGRAFSRQVANILVALLTPAAVVAFAMGMWPVCRDLGWAGGFFISDGLFSHWQVWIALSIGLKFLSSTLIAWGSRTGKFSEEN